MQWINVIIDWGNTVMETVKDISPIVILVAFFHIIVLKKPVPQPRKVFWGFVFVIIGLGFFLMGLKMALFPLGTLMAEQLTQPDFLSIPPGQPVHWHHYLWIYVFAGCIGFATTIAEPALKAVAIKAAQVSRGMISEWGLRLTVATGAGIALALGTFRIVTGTELYMYLLVCYIIVIVQTLFAPKDMIALAYDSGGVTTSTVTVPIVAALGLGLSSAIPGRNPAIDGFGIIALVCMFPIITVLGYAQLMLIIKKFSKKRTI
jgi:hypothetical protein